jgi:23S rRNA pseudouridine1911/1915/1917 synthase
LVITLTATAEHRGKRLDKFVAEALERTEPTPTRSEVQRWISAGRITLRASSSALTVSSKVREGDVYDVLPLEPPLSGARAQPELPLDIVHEDDALLVVCKRAGVVVHPAAGHADGTLVNALLGRGLFAQALTDGDHVRPGIVHRLDKDTSGLLVVARTAQAREHLKKQFAVHSIGREYVALAFGAVTSQTFSTLHGRHPTDRMRFTAKLREGRHAVTHVEALEALGPITYVKCTLQTGRTHQIRMHLSEAGAPIVGDGLYRFRTKDPVVHEVATKLGHHALHARYLAFEHPVSGKRLEFSAEPDADFTAALATLRSLFGGSAKKRAR